MNSLSRLALPGIVSLLLVACGGSSGGGSSTNGTPPNYSGTLTVTLDFPSACSGSHDLTSAFSYRVRGTYTSGGFSDSIDSTVSNTTLGAIYAGNNPQTLLSGTRGMPDKFPLNTTYTVTISQDASQIFFYCGGTRYYFEAATTLTPTDANPTQNVNISAELAPLAPLKYQKGAEVKSTWNHSDWS